ncbi:MAG TPA: hypothetical protein DEA95_04290 [Nitrospiraceae bacterium]|nr:hypothetical protein [Nitrospiraceae bacterium]
MHIYNVSDLALNNECECVLGSTDLKTHACYLFYGVLKLDEKERLIKAGKGHEEIVCLTSGEVLLKGEKETFNLKQGQAFHIKGDEAYLMDNAGSVDAVYVIAGGHSEAHNHKWEG